MKSKYFSIIVLGILIFSASCSDNEYDDYKKFAEDGEILYPEKMDSVKAFSGHERVKISGIIDADPKVSEFRVFWNNNTDSVSVPVTRGPGVDTLEVIIEDIEENIYNFEVRTYDEEGNKSLPVNVTGTVYGPRYMNSLINRPIVTNRLQGSNLTIDYASMDLSTGVIGTEINYTNSEDEEGEIFVSIDDSQAVIEDYLSGSTYQYRTVFIPEENAIDTFYTDYKAITPVPEITKPPYFENATAPFEIGDEGNRWHTPAAWIHNDAALSHGGFGTIDSQFGSVIALESGWGSPNIVNGKVYQSFVLEPGTYVYAVNVGEGNYDGNGDNGYFTVAEGGTLPDVADVETSSATLGFEKMVNVSNSTVQVVFTTVDPLTQVSVGIQTTNQAGEDKYIRFNSFQLAKVAQAPYLENASAPFEIGDEGGRWKTPADWVHNDAALNHGGYGTLDSQNNVLALESGWGAPNIVNGKVYQTFALEPGSYTFRTDINSGNYNAVDDQAYLTVARGTMLPDVSDVETSGATLGFERLINDGEATKEVSFTLEEITIVTLGFQTTNGEEANRYIRFNSFELIRN